MSPPRALRIPLATLILLCGSTSLLTAQTAPAPAPAMSQDELYKTIESLDAQLFDAYNHCDLAKLGSMVTDDLEFYHDKTGLAVGKQIFLESIKTNICGKVTRQLVA